MTFIFFQNFTVRNIDNKGRLKMVEVINGQNILDTEAEYSTLR